MDPKKILEQMDQLLDQLIQVAETMQTLSQQVVSETELLPLQKRQEELVAELTHLDATYHKAKPQPSPLRKKIGDKLIQFQTLNKAFIENLKGEKKLIEVEAPAVKKRKH